MRLHRQLLLGRLEHAELPQSEHREPHAEGLERLVAQARPRQFALLWLLAHLVELRQQHPLPQQIVGQVGLQSHEYLAGVVELAALEFLDCDLVGLLLDWAVPVTAHSLAGVRKDNCAALCSALLLSLAVFPLLDLPLEQGLYRLPLLLDLDLRCLTVNFGKWFRLQHSFQPVPFERIRVQKP